MWNSLRRIAVAVETLVRQSDHSELAEFMAQVTANQKRTLEQYEHAASASKEHRDRCEEYHKTMISQTTPAWRNGAR